MSQYAVHLHKAGEREGEGSWLSATVSLYETHVAVEDEVTGNTLGVFSYNLIRGWREVRGGGDEELTPVWEGKGGEGRHSSLGTLELEVLSPAGNEVRTVAFGLERAGDLKDALADRCAQLLEAMAVEGAGGGGGWDARDGEAGEVLQPLQLFESGRKDQQALDMVGPMPAAKVGDDVTGIWMRRQMEKLKDSNRRLVLDEQRLKTRVHRVEEERDMLWKRLTEERNRLTEGQQALAKEEERARRAEREVARLNERVAELERQNALAMASRQRILEVTQLKVHESLDVMGGGEVGGQGQGQGQGQGGEEGGEEDSAKMHSLSSSGGSVNAHALGERSMIDRLNVEMVKVQALSAMLTWPPLVLKKQVVEVMAEQARFRAKVMALHEKFHSPRYANQEPESQEHVEARTLFEEFDKSMGRALQATNRIDRTINGFLKDYHGIIAGARDLVPQELPDLSYASAHGMPTPMPSPR